RTTRRAGGADANRFPKTELIPGGYITSACSPLIYTGELLPKEYYGNNFVCDPANNLIHRELLRENGGAFKAVRAYPDREFLASTDNWFRPVHLTTGPDGAIYLLDFYREVIETPLSLPDDIKKQLNLESRGRGRIWRIAPTNFKPAKMPDLSKLRPSQLAAVVSHENPWQRLTAQRLLVQGKVAAAVPSLRGRLENTQGKPARVNLLWTLEGLGALEPGDVKAALNDPLPGVRENAVRLAERWLSSDGELQKKVVELARDTSSRVRFQLALSAGGLPEKEAAAALAEVLARGRGDSWTLTAALTSASHCRSRLLAIVSSGKDTNDSVSSVIASMVGRGGDEKEITDAIARAAAAPRGMEAALISGLGYGMQNSKTPLGAWLMHPPAGAEKAVAALRKRLAQAVEMLRDPKAAPKARLDAAVLLTFAPLDVAEPPLAEALDPSYPVEIQVLAVRALAAHPDAKVTKHVFPKWNGYAPSVRAAAVNSLLLRPERILSLLDAIEKKDIPAAALSPAQIQQLKAHPNARVKAKANAVFKQVIDADRAKVIASYARALELKGDANAGKGVFAKNCSACHKLDGVGNDVGANLLATIGNKSGEDLLVAIFDPNREVDPRYLSYQVGTADEKVYTGVIVAETPTSITVRRAEGAQDTILRADLAFLRATSISLMPVGLEKELKPQDVADLFAYLRTARK
ncbi:MAG TPA: c-type cytochrome, partial [Gemmata sp.]|nr:c-type cytochrome [Gemmata sp.]